MKVITDKRASHYNLVRSSYANGYMWATFQRGDGTTFDLTFSSAELAEILRTGFGMSASGHETKGNRAGEALCREVMRIADLIDADTR
jgi:hypothetical protein